MPNSRELALIAWGLLALGWCLTQPKLRASLVDVLRALKGKLLLFLALFGLWTAGLAWALARVGWWGSALLTSTVLWFLTAGLVFFGGFSQVTKEPHWVRRRILQAFGLTVVLEGLTSVFVLHLVWELLLVPVLFVLIGVSIVAARDKQHLQVKRLADGLLAVLGLALLTRALVGTIEVVRDAEVDDALREAALSTWLTLGSMPFVYVLGLYAGYETAWGRIDHHSSRKGLGRPHRWRAKAVLLATFNVRARDLGAFNGVWQFRLAEARSISEARRVLADFRDAEEEKSQQERAAAQRESEYLERLVRFADVAGTDDEGRQLDRREFRETQAALRWLATCQSGWYQRKEDGGRYRDHLLVVLEGGLGDHGLPEPHGVQMRVSADGQSWYAWRTTVGGWVFAIGSSGPPPSEWLYDGPMPPTDFPGNEAQWGSAPFSGEVSPNW